MIRAARWPALLPWLCVAAALGASAFYAVTDPRWPSGSGVDQGWWSFSDQQRYLASTLAWATGTLDPAQHWYLPGYPLLAVPFVRITPANPFLLPDAVAMAASAWLMGAVAAAVLPGWRWARALGALAFLLTVLQPVTMEVWVTPWTTTPACALLLGCVLALLRLMRSPGWRPALAAGGCAGCLATMRPSDGALAFALAAACCTARAPGWRASLPMGAALGLGAAIPAALGAALYVTTHGLTVSPYLSFSAALGFDWRLLPLQWVTLVLDPRPMLVDGTGMLAVYPFIATGLAGMAACLAAPPLGSRRLDHLIVAAASTGYGALYLCYRDLHPPALWQYYNYHYFKWLLPVFALYSVLLVAAARRATGALSALLVLAAILPWRVSPRVLAEMPAPAPGHRLDLPDGLGMGRGLVAAASGDFGHIYQGNNNFYFGPDGWKWYGASGSIAAYPMPGGLMLAPVRPLLPGPGVAVLDPGISLDPATRPVLLSLGLRYGRPCWLPAGLAPAACHSGGPLPASVFPPGRITMDRAAPFLLTGWADAEGTERWTVGPDPAFRLRFPASTGAAGITLDASGFVPPGAPPVVVTMRLNGVAQGEWRLNDSVPRQWHVRVPALPGDVRLDLAIENPRAPSTWLKSADTRQLGLRVHWLEIVPE